MIFEWAKDFPDLLVICRAFSLYHLDDPIRYHYKELKGFIQEGPQCGLVALAMCYGNPSKETVREVFQYAKENKYTNMGEIFSVDYMHLLAKKFLPNKIEIYLGKLDDNKIVEFLHCKGLILVPYDCDRDHRPCKKSGHKAHWAVISGMIETDDEIHVFAKHGKSLNTAIWSLKELARSNEQLNEVAPERKISDLYIIPDGRLNGPNGLCSRAVLIYPM